MAIGEILESRLDSGEYELFETIEREHLAKSFLAKLNSAFDPESFTYQKAVNDLKTSLNLDQLGRLLCLTVAKRR